MARSKKWELKMPYGHFEVRYTEDGGYEFYTGWEMAMPATRAELSAMQNVIQACLDATEPVECEDV